MPFGGERAFNWDSIPTVAKVGTDPAIEVQPESATYAVVVPAGKRFRPVYAKMTLVASADAANRQMYLVIYDAAGAVIFQSVLGLVVTAGQTQTQTWARMSMQVTAGTQYGVHFPDLELGAACQIRVGINNFDAVAAGDNASALTVYGKEAPA